MKPDWTKLVPHLPLQPGDDRYIPPSTGGGERIASWVLAGGGTVTVGGPAGIGKSTELSRAAEILQAERVACLLRLDQFESMREITADQILVRIAGRLAYMAISELELGLSGPLRQALIERKVLPIELRSEPLEGVFQTSAPSLATSTIREVRRLSNQGAVTLLIDGLERIPLARTRDVFDCFLALKEEVELVVVIPWQSVYGPMSDQVVRPGERFLAMQPATVEGPVGAAGRAFLRALLERRLSLPDGALAPGSAVATDLLEQWFVGTPTEEAKKLVDRAAESSGGIPRNFLQLMAQAATHARLRRGTPWPSEEDLLDAITDHHDSFRRLLMPGDRAAIQGVTGTDGMEMDLERKVRLLAHGVLLEREKKGHVIIDPHPLVRPLLGERENHA